MAGLLKDVSRDYDERMALRRRMLAHLDIELSEEATLEHRVDLRATLVGCAHCRGKEECELWLKWCRPGVPDTCLAGDAFLRLKAVSEQERSAPYRFR